LRGAERPGEARQKESAGWGEGGKKSRRAIRGKTVDGKGRGEQAEGEAVGEKLTDTPVH